MSKPVLISISLLLLINCSTLKKEDCLTINWKQQGIKDAKSGYKEPKASDYRSQCSQHDVKIQSIEYLKGFEIGLKEYCVYAKGYWSGKRGDDAHELCEEVSRDFKRGYDEGYLEFKKEKSKKELKEKILSESGGKECSFMSCKLEDNCLFSKCEKTGKECSFDHECTYDGRCDSVTKWTQYNDSVSVNICREPF